MSGTYSYYDMNDYNPRGCGRLILIVLAAIAIFIICWLCGCTAPAKLIVPIRYESHLIVTKKYYGQVLHIRQEKNYTLVIMQDGFVKLCGQVDVPAFVHAYIRTVPVYVDIHPDIRARLEHKYLSWPGSDKEYRIKTW